jgi:hypothetical protein
VRIKRRIKQDTPLKVGDVVSVPGADGRFLAAVVEIREDKGGRAPVMKILPFIDEVPKTRDLRRAAKSATRAEVWDLQPFFIVFNENRVPTGLPEDVEVVARRVVWRARTNTGGAVIEWPRFAQDARRVLHAYGVA